MQLTLCRRLRALRESRGLTQRQIAEKLEISQAAYCRMERGQIEISVVKLMYLAAMYGVKVSEIVEGL
jgi:transcriptional regulator with XRE-family HTH domain